MNKPTHLYHASQNREIAEFEPRAETVRDPSEGPVVFATASISYASCFLVKIDNSWTQISQWGDGPRVFICSDRTKFESLDKGGAIYTLSTDSFYLDPEKSSSEWVSKVPVKPIQKEIYDSGLTAMLDHGVQVFFVSQEEFFNILKAEDQGYEIISNLQKAGRSENHRSGATEIPI